MPQAISRSLQLLRPIMRTHLTSTGRVAYTTMAVQDVDLCDHGRDHGQCGALSGRDCQLIQSAIRAPWTRQTSHRRTVGGNANMEGDARNALYAKARGHRACPDLVAATAAAGFHRPVGSRRRQRAHRERGSPGPMPGTDVLRRVPTSHDAYDRGRSCGPNWPPTPTSIGGCVISGRRGGPAVGRSRTCRSGSPGMPGRFPSWCS
jgi:hypothetical protein